MKVSWPAPLSGESAPHMAITSFPRKSGTALDINSGAMAVRFGSEQDTVTRKAAAARRHGCHPAGLTGRIHAVSGPMGRISIWPQTEPILWPPFVGPNFGTRIQ